MITVRDLIYRHGELEFEILAGENGLDKEVKAISFIDAPSSVEWLRGNEVILTTAFLYQADERSLYQFVLTLINKNVTALGIKLGRYIKSLPAAIIDLADTNMFPIFVLPYEMVWSEFIERFYQKSDSYEDISKYLRVPLDSLIMRMDIHGINEVKQRQLFVESLNIPAAIVDNQYQLLSKNAVQGIDELEKYCASIQDSIRAHVFRMQTTIIENTWFLDAVLSGEEHLVIAVKDGGMSSRELDRLCILYHSAKKHRLRQNDQEFLVRSLIEGVVFSSSKSDMREIARQLDIEYDNKYWIIIVAGDDVGGGNELCKRTFEALFGPKKCFYSSVDVGVSESRHLVVFVSVHAPELKRAELDHQVQKGFFHKTAPDSAYKLYFSAACERFDDLRKSYLQAQTAYQYFNVLGDNHSVLHHYRDVEAFEHLLRSQVSVYEIEALAQKITSFDAVQALELYLEYNNIRVAAEKNFVHENTMRYRINKVLAEMDCDFSNPITRLSYLMKIKLWKLNKTQRSFHRIV